MIDVRSTGTERETGVLNCDMVRCNHGRAGVLVNVRRGC